MKLELKENMYIRTKGGIIDKILKLNKSYVKGVSQKDELYAYDIDNIVKTSYNIIDLIEVGDYLNGFKVSKIERYDTNTIIKIGNSTFNVLEGEKIYTPSYDNNNGYEKIEKLK